MLVFLYGVISCDVTNVNNFREILRYFFYILATPLIGIGSYLSRWICFQRFAPGIIK